MNPKASITTKAVLRTLLASLAFFFLMGAYYVMKANRKPIFIEQMGFEYMAWIYSLSSLVTILGVFFYNYMVSKVSRTSLLRLFFWATIGLFIGFWFILSLVPTIQKQWIPELVTQGNQEWMVFALWFFIKMVVQLYFLFAAAYVLFLVTLFWSFNHDLNTPEESKVLYPYIALGAQVGVIVGSKITKKLTSDRIVSPEGLLIVSAIGFFLCWTILEALKNFDSNLERDRLAKPKETGALKDIQLFFQNPYVFLIGLIVILPTFAGTLFDLQFTKLVQDNIPDKSLQTAFWAENDYYMGFANIAMCFLITPLLLRFAGVGISLSIQPILAVFSAVLFLFALNMEALAKVFPFLSNNALDNLRYCAIALNTCFYTLYQVGKEVFFVPTDKTVRYKMKAFCDTFLFRVGDAASSALIFGYGFFSGWIYGISYAILFICGAWVPVIFKTNAKYKKLVDELENEEQQQNEEE